MRDDIEALIDSGYTGLDKTHRNTDLSKKKTKNTHSYKGRKKTQQEDLFSERVLVENIFAHIKRFKIFCTKYALSTKTLWI